MLDVGPIGGVWAIRQRPIEWVAALSRLYAPALLQSHWFVPLITDLAKLLLYHSTLGISMIAGIGIFAALRRPVGAWLSTGAPDTRAVSSEHLEPLERQSLVGGGKKLSGCWPRSCSSW